MARLETPAAAGNLLRAAVFGHPVAARLDWVSEDPAAPAVLRLVLDDGRSFLVKVEVEGLKPCRSA